MDSKASVKLRVGARVVWEGNASDGGAVIETDYAAVKIKWDNGVIGIIAHDHMAPVSLAAPAPRRRKPRCETCHGTGGLGSSGKCPVCGRGSRPTPGSR